MQSIPVFLLAAFSLISQSLFAQTTRQFDLLARHQQCVADVPGYVVAVVAGDKVIYEKSIGVANTKSGRPVNRFSDFHMASVSKPFAATAILQLCDQGQLNLDSTLASYLPGFSMKDPRYKSITLYHILTHSSGIPDVTNYEWENPQTNEQSAMRYTMSFTESSLDFEPGTEFRYSNAAYDILAAVVQQVTG